MQPKVGNIVHHQAFRTTSGEPIPVARAAIVTEISSLAPASSMRVGLCVLNPDGLFFKYSGPCSVAVMAEIRTTF